MKNIAFVIWMIGFPLCVSLDSYVSKIEPVTMYSANVEGMAAILTCFVWFIVGVYLFEPNKN